MKFEVFSVGLYSSYCYNETFGCLFDAGEGVATQLRNRIGGIDYVFLTHNHWDHIGGLAGLVSARSVARTDKTKPITIVHPASMDLSVRDLVESMAQIEVNWVKLPDYGTVELSPTHYVQSFPVRHTHCSVGYKIVEKRTRLSSAYRGMSQERIVAYKQKGICVSEAYDHILFAYTLDSASFNKSDLQNADWWIADCTFLSPKDRKKNSHMSLKEIGEYLRDGCAKNVVLAHVSTRYARGEILPAVSRYLRGHDSKTIHFLNNHNRFVYPSKRKQFGQP